MRYYEFKSSNSHKNINYLLLILVLMASMVFAYFFYVSANNNKAKIDIKEEKTPITKVKENNEVQSIEASQTPEKVTPNTKFVYQYYYKKDDKTISDEKMPEYFMINMSEEELKNKLEDWEIKEFSNKRVVLKREINGRSPNYFMIGEKDGFIAAFYKNADDDVRLREITDTPISTLPEEEQLKIRDGITVYGEEELIKMLEDYSS